MTASDTEINTQIVEHLFRHQSGKMSAILTRLFGFQNESIIEDIIQESFIAALKVWGMKGVPENPEAWLMTVAKNKLINELNRQKRQAEKRAGLHSEHTLEDVEELFLDHEIRDSQLRVLFACCDPHLKPRVQIMLTLKVLSGFGNKEIANALLMTPTAVKKAIYRARSELGVVYKQPDIPFVKEASKRLDTVLKVLYLMFNEGYKVSVAEQLTNEDLCLESVRLTALLLRLPEIEKAKIYALLALMYLTLARFPSRQNAEGEIVDIEFQDRSLWDRELMNQGFYFFKRSRTGGELSSYHLESAIAATHCSADGYEKTNWKRILECYQRLLDIKDTFQIRVNHSFAIGMSQRPEKGLELLRKLEEYPGDRMLLYSAMGRLNEQLKDFEKARSYYLIAMDHSIKVLDKDFLGQRVEACQHKNIHSN